MIYDVALVILAYLLGSIPFGIVVTRLAGTADIRTHGSCNIGATNVLRLAGKKLGLVTLLLDCLKGVVAVALATMFSDSETIILLAAAFSVIGHIFPVWLRFKGGKGVATMLAVIITVSWPVGLVACLIWLVTFSLFRISSLSSLMAAISAPLAAAYFTSTLQAPDNMVVLTSFLSLLVIMRHKENIHRLLSGTEKRFSLKR